MNWRAAGKVAMWVLLDFAIFLALLAAGLLGGWR